MTATIHDSRPPMIVSLYGGTAPIRTAVADMIAYWCRHLGLAVTRSAVIADDDGGHDGYATFLFTEQLRRTMAQSGADCLLFEQAPLDRIMRRHRRLFGIAHAQQCAIGLDPAGAENLNLVLDPAGDGAITDLLRQTAIPFTTITPDPMVSIAQQTIGAFERHAATRLGVKPMAGDAVCLAPAPGV